MYQHPTHRHILDLPTELLAFIFDFIPYDGIDDLCLVCTRFEEVAKVTLSAGLNWIRRQTADVVRRLENEEEYEEEKRKKRKRWQSKRSKAMEKNWRFRKYQSFIVIIYLSRLFIATFYTLASANILPLCSGSLIGLYYKALQKTKSRPTFIAKIYQREIFHQTAQYKATSETELLKSPKLDRRAVLRTILESLQCFPLKDTTLKIEDHRVHYRCSLPGCWLQVFRHNGDASAELTLPELVLAMFCLYDMVTCSIAQCSGAEYLVDDLTDGLRHWRDYSVFFGTTGYSPCYLPLVFDFVIPCERKSISSYETIGNLESDEFALRISSPVRGRLYRNDYMQLRLTRYHTVTSYTYRSPNFTDPMETFRETPFVCRKRLRPVSSSTSCTDPKVVRLE